MKKPILFLASVALALSATAAVKASFNTIPKPDNIELLDHGKPFTLGADVDIVAPEGLAAEARFLRDYMPAGLKGKSSGQIILRDDLMAPNPEAYTIAVGEKDITILGASPAGVFYGIQTLRKALPVDLDRSGRIEIPSCKVTDAPRFGYRGAHFDVSRHFFTVDEVKQFIDMIALHGLNTLHWHLTDDQGWRIQIDKYPCLTEVGSYRPNSIIGRNGPEFDNIPVSGFYTKDQVRDVVKYAADRHIRVIPEIDLPGHMMAAMASYPELGCTGGPYEVWRQWGVNDGVLCPGKDNTMQFIEDVLTEVADLFPAPYFHIGGDECPKVLWANCEHCQARIKELGLEWKDGVSPESQLQGYVTAFACDVLRKLGKRAIGWDEILECDIPQDAIIMSWRGVDGAAKGTARGHEVILTPTSHCYFDFYQTKDVDREPFAIGGLTTVEKVYSLEPTLPSMTPEQKALVLGCQANLWTEYIASFPHVQYMELPRLAALAEVQWRDPDDKDFNDFLTRVPALLALYDKLGYNYAHHITDVDMKYNVDPGRHALVATASALPGYDLYYTLDGSEPSPKSTRYTGPLVLADSCILSVISYKDGVEGRAICDTIAPSPIAFCPITLAEQPDAGYRFGGAQSLVDGIKGNGNYRTGRWIGFSGKNCDATIELPGRMTLTNVTFNTAIFTDDAVAGCRGVQVFSSDNGSDWHLIASEEYPATEGRRNYEVETHSVNFSSPREMKYLRVVIRPEYIFPAGHHYAGCLGFLFVDEIEAH